MPYYFYGITVFCRRMILSLSEILLGSITKRKHWATINGLNIFCIPIFIKIKFN